MTARRLLLASVVAIFAIANPSAQAVRATMPTGVTSTARASGHVVDEIGAPVGRAIVQLSGGGLTRSLSTVTDQSGAFDFTALPAGQFTVTASKPPYVTSSYGSKSPGRPGTPLRVATGQIVTGLSIVLTRGAVIEGRVSDPNGEPVGGVQVAIVRTRAPRTGTRLPTAPEDAITTDDRGIYRAFGLEPGSYFVAVGLRQQAANMVTSLSTQQIDTLLQDLQRRGTSPPQPARSSGGGAMTAPVAFAPVFYPGTPNVADAIPIVVEAGEVRGGIDIVLRPIRTATIAGTIVSPDGDAIGVEMNFSSPTPFPLPLFFGAEPTLNRQPQANGAFRFQGVPPGPYVLTARSAGGGLWARTDLSIDGSDVMGLTLNLAPAPRLSGRVVFDATTLKPPANLTTMRVRLLPIALEDDRPSLLNDIRNGPPVIQPVAMAEESTFEISGILPATYTVGLATSVGRWWLRSAVAGGIDLLDTPLDISADVDDLVLTLSDRHSELAGTLQTPAGTPATDYFVVVFTTDKVLWRPAARRVVFVRPATDGTFSVADLPAGAYYVAALTDLDPNDWKTPEFLAPLVPASVQVAITDGERTVQNLRIR